MAVYSIKDLDEALLYMGNNFLKQNYITYIDELTRILNTRKTIEEILGNDHIKCISQTFLETTR